MGIRWRTWRKRGRQGEMNTPTLTAGVCARAGFFRVQDKECKRLVMGTEFESIAGKFSNGLYIVTCTEEKY